MGDFFDEHFVVTLLFIGAGGQDKISGILNLWAFGVEQPTILSLSPSWSLMLTVHDSLELVEVVLWLQGRSLDGSSHFGTICCLLHLVDLLVFDGAMWGLDQ